MQKETSQEQPMILGKVASLHLHSVLPGERMQDVFTMELVAGKGIAGNKRYFSRPTRRQVTLIEREQIAEHAAVLGLDEIIPGQVRSNIETTGIWFRELVGKQVQIGTSAVLFLYEARIPCHKMEAIAPGMRRLLENGRQGVLAQVVVTGVVQIGDTITLANAKAVQ
ncbi:MAG: MOSC domain-containing protein [Verrucomicrobiota bacterium]